MSTCVRRSRPLGWIPVSFLVVTRLSIWGRTDYYEAEEMSDYEEMQLESVGSMQPNS